MEVINFIKKSITTYKALPNKLKIQINNKCLSFFEGINLIFCNKLKEKDYLIKCKEYDFNINEQQKSMFALPDKLEEIIKEKELDYNFYLNDTTKTNFFITISPSIINFKDLYHTITNIKLSDILQYVLCNVERFQYFHCYNEFLFNIYEYNQVLVKLDFPNINEKSEDYILIKLCHDNIIITKDKITFTNMDTYNIVQLLFPYLNTSEKDTLIQFIPTSISFTYPIAINFQLFNLMLFKYNLYPYVYTNESNGLIINQEKVTFTLNIFNISVDMTIYNKYKQFTEIIYFQELEWYMYLTVKDILGKIYLLYIDFHKTFIENNLFADIPIKLNYNRLFGKYYTRYFNNKDKILPVIANKEYCDKNNIPYVKWNDAYYMAPENSGYIITAVNNKIFSSNGVPKCVKVVRRHSNKKQITYNNISYEIDENNRGKISSTLFISNGYEIPNLLRVYFDIGNEITEFKTCSKCKTYIKLPSQYECIEYIKNNYMKSKIFKNSPYDSDINVLAFSIEDDKTLFPYGVFNYSYNYNSSYPFIIVMLNTTKQYTVSNYRFEFIISDKSNFFDLNDKCVQAIFSIYQNYNISVIDNTLFLKYHGQYAVNNKKTIFIAESSFSDKKYYLWRSIYTNIIPELPIMDNDAFISTLPSLSLLKECINEITSYHYCQNYLDNSKIIIFGVWYNEIYYPCQITTLKSEMINTENKPFLLLKRKIDGSIFPENSNNSDFIFIN